MDGHVPAAVVCPDPEHTSGYCPVPPDSPGAYPFVPDFVDGLRVTSSVNNPTTFARAIPNPLSNLKVGAKAAVRLYPSCVPDPSPGISSPLTGGTASGQILPLTRFRPAVEKELFDPTLGNSVCNVFSIWNGNPDIVSVGNNSSAVNNVLSLDHDTLHSHDSISQQMITGFDQRAGPSPPNPLPPEGGLSYYDPNNIFRTLQPCTVEPCVNMHNAGIPQGGGNLQPPTVIDLANWVFWQWRGTLSTNNSAWNGMAGSETGYQSTRQDRANGTGPRLGDWAETAQNAGNDPQTIQKAVHDLADQFGVTTALSTNLNWGKAITTTIYVWGEPAPSPSPTSGVVPGDNTSAQIWDTWYDQSDPCAGTPTPDPSSTVFPTAVPTVSAWTDLNISGTHANYGATNVSCGGQSPSIPNPTPAYRVRFTKAYTVVLYANLQGDGYGAQSAPNCPALPNAGSAVRGILPDIPLQDPSTETNCVSGWAPGGGVYFREIDPNPTPPPAP
jgi:hypothetical protein